MAGWRETITKMLKRYGYKPEEISGAKYSDLVGDILKENVSRTQAAVYAISGLRWRRALKDSLGGELQLPEYAIPRSTAKKCADMGKAISDTVRDKLSDALRKSIAGREMGDVEGMVEDMQKAVEKILPSANSRTVAVTEVRSAVDQAKWEYALEFSRKNGNSVDVYKRWRHNDHLVKNPRVLHEALDGRTVKLHEKFGIYRRTKTLWADYPHDTKLPPEEVIGCCCSYEVLVEPKVAKPKTQRSRLLKSLQNEVLSLKVSKGEKFSEANGYKLVDGRWHKTGEDALPDSKRKSFEEGVGSPAEEVYHAEPVSGGSEKSREEREKKRDTSILREPGIDAYLRSLPPEKVRLLQQSVREQLWTRDESDFTEFKPWENRVNFNSESLKIGDHPVAHELGHVLDWDAEKGSYRSTAYAKEWDAALDEDIGSRSFEEWGKTVAKLVADPKDPQCIAVMDVFTSYSLKWTWRLWDAFAKGKGLVGHSADYWSKFPERKVNEGFANFFMLRDADFVERVFPKSFKLYEKMYREFLEARNGR